MKLSLRRIFLNQQYRKHINVEQIDHLWKRMIHLADKRGGLLFNDGIRLSQGKQSCVLISGKKKILFRFLSAIAILILFYLGIKHLPKGNRWDELHGMFILYGFFIFIALPAAFFKFFRSSKCVVDNANVVVSYWDFGRYRKLSVPTKELVLKLYYNERPRRERKIPSGYCVLSLVHDSFDPKELIITSAKKPKEIILVFEALERYFGEGRVSYFKMEPVEFSFLGDDAHNCPEFLDDLPYHAIPHEERKSLKNKDINQVFSHHSYVEKGTYADYVMALVMKWRIRAWLGYLLAVGICSLSAIFSIICLLEFGLFSGVLVLMLIFIVSLAPTMWGTNELLCRYGMMDKSSNSLTYHPWPHSQWSRVVCKLSDIKAIQLCLSFENVEKGEEYCPSPTYQLNMVTTIDKPFKRLNLTTDKDEKRIREQARQVADFLEIPIYDHCS